MNEYSLAKVQLNTYRIVRDIQREYRVDYFDYREDVRFESDDFYDQSHLSEVGAEKFTMILMKDIKNFPQ